MSTTTIHRDTWKHYAREPVTFDGVDSCLYVVEFGEAEITVELIPEDEHEDERWPVNVLRLPQEEQHAIQRQLTHLRA